MTFRLPLIVILLFAFSRLAFAAPDFESGNYMLPHCKTLVESKTPAVWEGQCGGVIDALLWVGASLPEGGRFCPPKGIPPAQADRVVVRWLETHPEKLHLNFKGLALQALMEAWPCSAK